MNQSVYAFGPWGFGVYRREGETLEPGQGAPEAYWVPGFVDMHIHGGFGVDFMSASRQELLGLCDRLADLGYETFLPTTVAAPADRVEAALANLPEHPMIGGFHLEGPFLSAAYPGAQPPDALEPPPALPSDWDSVLDDPRLRVVTLAPEAPGAGDLIRRLARRDVKVGIGHTNATYAEAAAGFAAGASHATHAFNAMRPFHHREAGATGFVLLEPGLAAELIYDRIHVSREAAALLLRCKSAAPVIAVSDGTAAIGLPAGTKLSMWGNRCVVGDGDVRLESGALAGSAITLLDAFRNLAEDFGPGVAVAATSLAPRKHLGLGAPKVHLLMDLNYELLEVVRT